MHVLIIEDDKDVAAYITKGLSESGYVVDAAHTGTEGLSMAQSGQYDILIVDRMLPELDGLSVIEKLRKDGMSTPVLILSALGEVDDRVEGLAAGGDDYLVKPYAFSELLARVQALTRRRGRKINLQPREFRLLEYLMSNAGQVVTRTMLLEKVWEYHFDPQTNVIDVHISRLRSKIDKDFDPPLIHTERGAGYSLYDPNGYN